MRIVLAAALVSCLISAPVGAQPADAAPLVDAAQPASGGAGWKYFFLHMPGISFDQALGDFHDCYPQITVGASIVTPAFVPWRRAAVARPQVNNGGSYGLVGMAIGAMIAGPIERSYRQMRLARCMLPRGYGRYSMTKEAWQQLNGGDQEQSMIAQARLASGVTPTSTRMVP